VMADQEKVREFIKTAGIMDQFLGYLNSRFKKDGSREDFDSENIKMVQVQQETNQLIIDKISEFLVKIYQETFDNEEIDELIDICSTKVYKKLFVTVPKIEESFPAFLEETELGKEIEELFKKVGLF